MNSTSSDRKTFGYVRVGSVEHGSLHGLINQVRSLTSAGIEEENIRFDIGSANAENRPGFECLTRHITEGKAQEIIITRADRLFRRPSDFIIFKKLLDNSQVTLRILNFSNKNWDELSDHRRDELSSYLSLWEDSSHA